jgi:hypothetical protein
MYSRKVKSVVLGRSKVVLMYSGSSCRLLPDVRLPLFTRSNKADRCFHVVSPVSMALEG